MPATNPVLLSGDQDIDGLLETDEWAVSELTFSFPTSSAAYEEDYVFPDTQEPFTNFAAFTAGQQDATRRILAHFSTVANLTFTEATGAAAAGADLRFGRTDDTEVAHAYTPTALGLGGDSWYNHTGEFALVANPILGGYDYSTLLHEVGHALGLKHGHEVYTQAEYGVHRPAMTAAHDSMEFSVMTYRPYVGANPFFGYTNETWGFAQTLMMYDIAALQHMYGANFDHNAGASVYRWNPNTGEMTINGIGQGEPGGNRVFLTVWDGGGKDTYNLSAYDNGVSIDLRPGQWTTTSEVQIANLGDGNFARGNIANALLFEGNRRSYIENAVGGDGNDTLGGNNIANRLTGGRGNDVLNGRGGADTMNGGRGNDVYFVNNVNDKVIESLATGGTDEVRSAVTFSLAGQHIETLKLIGGAAVNATGNSLDNLLIGNSRANRLDGGGGADTMRGGGGNDRYVVNNVGDAITEGASGGVDTVLSYVNQSLGRNLENLTLGGTTAVRGIGNGLANRITGNGVANQIEGWNGADFLNGAGGNDRLFGGSGNDRLSGKAGADRFYFDTALNETSNVDRLLDFVAADDGIVLDRTIFDAIGANGTLAAGVFRSGTAALDANDRIIHDKATGNIFYDADGSGATEAILFASVTPETALTRADFIAIA